MLCPSPSVQAQAPLSLGQAHLCHAAPRPGAQLRRQWGAAGAPHGWEQLWSQAPLGPATSTQGLALRAGVLGEGASMRSCCPGSWGGG